MSKTIVYSLYELKQTNLVLWMPFEKAFNLTTQSKRMNAKRISLILTSFYIIM